MRRRNPAAKKSMAGLKKYQRLVARAKKAGVSTKGGTEAIERRLAEQKNRAANKRRSRRASASRRKVARVRALRAKRRPVAAAPLKVRLKAFKAKKRAAERAKAVNARVRRARASGSLKVIESRQKSLRGQADRLQKRIDTLREKAARKNGGEAMHYGLGFVGGFVVEQALAGAVRKMVQPVGAMVHAVEYGVPAAGIAATHFLGGKLGLSPQAKVGVIAGMIGGVVARNVGAVQNIVAKIPGLGMLATLGQELPLSAYYAAGAAGMGRYVTDSALGNVDLADDLYAGQAGMGRYMLDDTANFGVGQFELEAGAAGFGEYIQEPAALEGFGGMHDDDMEELMDDLGSVPVLTPDEEQAENILIPELAHEAMNGFGAVHSSPVKIKPRGLRVARTTPGMAAKVQQAKIGEIIGESYKFQAPYWSQVR